MKKLILAISSVFLLQLGFIAYNANDPAAETAFLVLDEEATEGMLSRRVDDPAAVEPELADIDMAPSADLEASDTSPEFAADIMPSVARSQSDLRPARSNPKKRQLNTFVSAENFEKLQPVKVEYKVHAPVAFKALPGNARTEYPIAPVAYSESRRLEASAKPAAQPAMKKKRNLFTRVITKPYDWLKAVGSALK